MNGCFLSCDWGTTSFRLRLVQRDGLVVLAEEVNAQGIAETYRKWKAANEPEKSRLSFYQSYVHGQMKKLEEKAGCRLQELPLLISGMASSSIGMMELPYTKIPFQADGSDLNISIIEPSENHPGRQVLISGAKTGDDVLRGEETLLAGCAVERLADESVYIFPGTHSKHIRVRAGAAQQLKTYMTGEFFDLLATKSILSNSVEKNVGESVAHQYAWFERGILEAASSNLLNSVFHVRTAQLFQKNTPRENYHYLSGLLVGAELKDLIQPNLLATVLVAGEKMERPYRHGLTLLGLNKNLEFKNADAALIRGQLRIYESVEAGKVKNKLPGISF
jgi:2-dehydro-3-deoxygalactonokinase